MELADLAKTSTWATGVIEPRLLRRQARELGWVETAIRKGDGAVTELRPTTRDKARPRSLSASVGLGEQPLHTDGAHLAEPPDWLILYAEAPNQTPTLLWSPLVRSAGTPRLRPGWPEEADAGVFLVESGKDRFLATAERPGGGFRYDPGCMTPCDERARHVARHLREAQTHAEQHNWSEVNQVLVISNRFALHARAAVAEADAGRAVTRIAYRAEKQS
jgi:hypothetical protein